MQVLIIWLGKRERSVTCFLASGTRRDSSSKLFLILSLRRFSTPCFIFFRFAAFCIF